MPWVADAVFGAGRVANPVQRRRAPTAGVGELRNPTFPSKVGAIDDWTGTIDAVNTGTVTDTFRFRVDDVASDSFDLGPGASLTISESGTGPKDFWIYLDRWVPLKWVEWIKKNALLIGAASTCVVGLAVVAVKA